MDRMLGRSSWMDRLFSSVASILSLTYLEEQIRRVLNMLSSLLETQNDIKFGLVKTCMKP